MSDSDHHQVPGPDFPPVPPGFRVGLAAIVGRTNAGKSTLLNRLVGRKVSIVSPKPQTTRDALHGVVHRPEGQIVFVDTPGFFQTHASPLVDKLHSRAREAVSDLDALVHLVDPTREPGQEDAMVLALVETVRAPKILCVGKADSPSRPYAAHWQERAGNYANMIQVSGASGAGVEDLVRAILGYLPQGQPLYPPGEITNANQKHLIGELIREQIYLQMEDEVPYRTRVVIELLQESGAAADGSRQLIVYASVLVPNERLQRMLIGVGAKRVKQLRQFARRELRRQLGRAVVLEIDILVDRNAEE